MPLSGLDMRTVAIKRARYNDHYVSARYNDPYQVHFRAEWYMREFSRIPRDTRSFLLWVCPMNIVTQIPQSLSQRQAKNYCS